MPIQIVQKAELLRKTADYYRHAIADYARFAQTERKPRTKKQLERRLEMILQEIDSLQRDPVGDATAHP
jgi:hypothetical protein